MYENINKKESGKGLLSGFNPIPPGLFEGGSAWGRGGGKGRKVPANHYSKTINDNGMKFGGVVENYKLINLV